jgi:hypothetical protein
MVSAWRTGSQAFIRPVGVDRFGRFGGDEVEHLERRPLWGVVGPDLDGTGVGPGTRRQN